MLQDYPISSSARHEAAPCILETERLLLRRPTLADVRAIARLANDRRIAEHTRRLPHPYSEDHAVELVRALAGTGRDAVFLIEHNFVPVGMAGISWCKADAPELGYWLGAEHWGRGFGTEAARAVIDHFFETHAADQLHAGARVANPASRNVLEKCGFKWSSVELHRFEALGSSTPVDIFRLSRSAWSALRNWANSAREEG